MSQNYFNIPFYTTGGLYWWRDMAYKNGWKVQQNTISKTCRVIDNYGIRRARGDMRFCLNEMKNLLAIWEKPESQNATAFIIGAGKQSALTFYKIKRKLLLTGFNVCFFNYSAFFHDAEENARICAEIMASLTGEARELHCLTYGAGNLILRKALALNPEIKIAKIVQIMPTEKGFNWWQKILMFPVLGKGSCSLAQEEVAKTKPLPQKITCGLIRQTTKKRPNSPQEDVLYIKGQKLFMPMYDRVANAAARFLMTGKFYQKREIKKVKPAFNDVL